MQQITEYENSSLIFKKASGKNCCWSLFTVNVCDFLSYFCFVFFRPNCYVWRKPRNRVPLVPSKHSTVFNPQILWCLTYFIFYMLILTSLWLFVSRSVFVDFSLCSLVPLSFIMFHHSFSTVLSFCELICCIHFLQGVEAYGKVSHLELSMDGPDLLHSILNFYKTLPLG